MRNATLLFLTCSTALLAQGGRPLPTVSLKVTVNTSQQFTTSTTDVLPDGAGQYIDGQNGVCAFFNGVGDLIVDFGCQSVANPRQLGFNLSTFLAPPTGGTNTCSPPSSISPGSSPAYTSHLGTAKAPDMPTAAFQSMSVYDGTAATVYYVEIFIATKFSDTNQTAYRLNYHGTYWSSFADAAVASYAQVRRTSSTQWVVEPVTPSALAGNPHNVAMLVRETSSKHSSVITECGFYQVPFSFTLDQK